MSVMLPSAAVPSFDRKGGTFSNYAQQEECCRRVTNVDVAKQSPALARQVDPIAKDAYGKLDSDLLVELDAAAKV